MKNVNYPLSVLDPLGVGVQVLLDRLANLLLPVAVAVDGVLPVHAQHVVGQLALEVASATSLL